MRDNRLAVLFWITYAFVVVSVLAYAASAITSVPWRDIISAAWQLAKRTALGL